VVVVTDVDLVIDFLNTVDHEGGTDVLTDPVAWSSWLASRSLTGGGPSALRAARDALRVAVGDHGQATDVATTVRVELMDGTPRVVTRDVLGAVLAAASRLSVLGQWERVKICPARDCRWAFYDRSRNHSRTWCSMQTCGNRQKARAWRERTGN
jgi:predicted RNA-binding Zn ribbon-like protein